MHFIIALALSVAPAAMATCYYPDGSINHIPDYQPCRSSTKFSMCCATNRTAATSNWSADSCLVNGLCANGNGQAVDFWRESCTDPTWQSPFCLRSLCASSANGGTTKDDIKVLQCQDGSWCCNPDTNTFLNCCNGNQGVHLPEVIGVSSVASDSAATTAAATTAATSSGNTVSTGAAVGIGIGSAAAGIILSGVVAFIYIRKQSSTRVQHQTNFPPEYYGVVEWPKQGQVTEHQQFVELQGGGRTELQ